MTVKMSDIFHELQADPGSLNLVRKWYEAEEEVIIYVNDGDYKMKGAYNRDQGITLRLAPAWSYDECLDYWRTPDQTNKAKGYLSTNANERSDYLVSLFEKHIDQSASILEIGCSVGRNLAYLWQAGYQNLSGLEINKEAVAVLRRHYPELSGIPVTVGSIEEKVKELEQVDVIYTMAVFEHIHIDSDWIFRELAGKTNTIITIEDEVSFSVRHFPRNYRMFFERLGFSEIFTENCNRISGLGDNFETRVMTR